ncbi:MAG TPA: hypothetical protein DCP63_06855 [Bacteroidetes bacterium]|nr:hypothetical protein [Bacteroidota bacterium]
MELGGDALTLIITGPNAGGKSVAMKTVGLLCLCMQAGIHLPAASESELCVLDNIFADIGDDQSIEDDLSTFSSHLHSVRRILAEASSQSLVLIDEIGAGTDPAEGGALAASILRDLTDRGTLTIATTHHGMLKAFAHESPGIVNGSMEFDQDDLRPTYKFRMGVPGSSYALELARRLGLPSSITDRARELVGDDRVKLDHLLSDLERQSQSYREQIKEVSQERDRLNKLVEVYEHRVKELKTELRDIKRKAVSEAEEIVKGAHSLIERSVKEIRESAAEKAKVKIARENVQRLAEDVAALKSEEKHDELSNFVVGDTVRLRGGSETGEIVALKESMATVLWGDGKLRVNIQDLKKERRQKTSSSDKGHQLYLIEAKNEIDVRGLMGDEAIPIIQNFLDNAVAAGLHRVDIIHGKGTGALRKKVTGFLKTYVRLKSFRLGEWNEGGAGVTVVELAD